MNLPVYSKQKIVDFFKKRFYFLDLTIETTTFYKALAIIIIVFHNFLHWVPPKIGENEQDFLLERAERFINIFYEQPEYGIQAIFSFLGHYGVQIFLFLSAYGLTKKYLTNDIKSYKQFLKYRILKIYPAFILSIVILFIYYAATHGGIPHAIDMFVKTWKSFLYKLTFVSNFIPRELYKINGPWWFISLIVQFYVVFPFMLKIYKKYGTLSLIILSLVGLVITAYLQPYVKIYLPGTILTHLPELSLGIYMANKGKFSLSYLSILLIFIIFILSNVSQFFWYFSFLSVTILLLIIFQYIYTNSSRFIYKNMLFIGTISMYIFYVNGFLRKPWVGIAKHYNAWYINILFSLFFFLFVVVVSYSMMKIEKNIASRFTKIMEQNSKVTILFKRVFRVRYILLLIVLFTINNIYEYSRKLDLLQESSYSGQKVNVNKNNKYAILRRLTTSTYLTNPGINKPIIAVFTFKDDFSIEVEFLIKDSTKPANILYKVYKNKKEIAKFVLYRENIKQKLKINLKKGDKLKIIIDKNGSPAFDLGVFKIYGNSILDTVKHYIPLIAYLIYIILFIFYSKILPLSFLSNRKR